MACWPRALTATGHRHHVQIEPLREVGLVHADRDGRNVRCRLTSVQAWPVERFSAELDAVMTALLNCALSGGSNTKAAAE